MRRRASSPTLSLELTYSGLRPPTDLFDDLRMIGWRPPAVPPPPKTAIDWSRADPATGKAFTILDFEVAGAVVEPPAGSGPRQAWTAADHAAFVLPLRGVLRRHGLTDHLSYRQHVDPDAGARPGPAPTGTKRGTGVAGGTAPEVSGFGMALAAPPLPPPPVPAGATPNRPAPAAPAARPTPAAPSTRRPPPPAPIDHGFALVTAVATAGTAETAGAALAPFGLVPRVVAVERTREERFRGSAHQVTTTVHEWQVVVPASLTTTVVAAWRDAGLAARPVPVDAAAAAAFDRAARDEAQSSGTDGGRGPDHDAGRATRTHVSVVADQRRSPLLQAALDDLDLADVEVVATTRASVTTFRGSRTETQVPAVRIDAWVDDAAAAGVVARLAAAAGLDPSDELVRVTPGAGADTSGTGQPAVT